MSTGRSVASVVADPFVLTLWTWAHLMQHDRIEGLIRRGEQLRAATEITVGFHEPKKLGDIGHDYQRQLGMLPDKSELMAAASSIVADVRILDAYESQQAAKTPEGE